MTAAVIITAVVIVGSLVGNEIYKKQKELQKKLESSQKAAKAAGDTTEKLPYVKGAKNAAATGRSFPFAIGKSLMTPYRLCSPHYTISGTNGAAQYYTTVLEIAYNNIVIDKIKMDCNGLAVLPDTYFESLKRKNELLYGILMDNDRFHRNREAWTNDVMSIITTIESSLSMHLKYFEQSVLGETLFFKPLVTLINHFKSILVDISKTGLRYIFDDKIDVGGNSNMFKLFDEIPSIIHNIILAGSGYESDFGLYDTEHTLKHHILLSDKLQKLIMKLDHKMETAEIGAFGLIDMAKFYKNGEILDSAGDNPIWFNGDNNMSVGSLLNQPKPADLEAWKDFVESSVPDEN